MRVDLCTKYAGRPNSKQRMSKSQIYWESEETQWSSLAKMPPTSLIFCYERGHVTLNSTIKTHNLD